MAVETTTMTCGDCGTRLRHADRYCPACDAPNPAHRFPQFRPRITDLPRQTSEPMRRPAMRAFNCPRCTATVATGSWLCAGCGLDVAKLLAEPQREALDGVWMTPGPNDIEPYRPIGTWTGAWKASLALAAILSLVVAALLLVALVADGGYRLPIEVDRVRLGEIAVRLSIAFAVGVAAVLLLAVGWTNRAYRNLAALGATGFRIAPDVVAAAWFVPGVNMFIPMLALRDVWRASDPRMPFRSDAWHKARVAVPIWESWAMSIIGGIAIVVGWWGVIDVAAWNETVSQSSLAIAGLGHVLLAIGLFQLMVVAESVADRQRERAERIGPPEALQRLAMLGRDEAADEADRMADVVALRAVVGGEPVYGKY